MKYVFRIEILLAVLLLSFAVEAKTAFSLRDWMSKDQAFKVMLIQSLIEESKTHRVTMKLSPEYYVKEIDSLVELSIRNGDEAGLDNSLMISFKSIAIMDCDWSNGENHLEYALSFMGKKNLENVKSLYPEKYKKLEVNCGDNSAK